jgi:hypothetical protein
MAMFLIMDHTGDSRHFFDPADGEGRAAAEARFNDLIADGYTAAVRTMPGKAAIVRSFDPAAEETLFYPRLVGG